MINHDLGWACLVCIGSSHHNRAWIWPGIAVGGAAGVATGEEPASAYSKEGLAGAVEQGFEWIWDNVPDGP